MGINEIIRNTRIKNKMTQKDLAEAMKVGQPYISAVENGETTPTPMFLELFDLLFSKSIGVEAGKYGQAVARRMENGNYFSSLKDVDTVYTSAGVLDFISERHPELSLKETIDIMEDAKTLLLQIREL